MSRNIRNPWMSSLAGITAVSVLLASLMQPGIAADRQAADAATAAVSPMQYDSGSTDSTLPNFLKAGPFEFRPFFAGSLLYDDNIRIKSTDPIEDLVWTLSPGMLIGAGEYEEARETYLTLEYRPDIILYTDNTDFNTVDHWVNFVGQKKWEKLSLGLGQAFQSGAGGYSEALNRVDRSVYLTSLKGLYQYSEKTSLELNAFQGIYDYERSQQVALTSYNQWQAQLWANYQATPKINLGIGGTVGWRDIQGAANQSYQQALLRTIYFLSPKTRFHVNLGGEFQQFQNNGSPDPLFIFDVGGTYQPWVRTTFSVSAYRRNQNSVVLSGQNFTATGFRASVRQQAGDRLYLTFTGGYESADYYGAGTGPSIDRNDNYFFIRPAIDYSITERWSVGMFYQYRDNDSSLSKLYSFSNNQAGLRTLFRF